MYRGYKSQESFYGHPSLYFRLHDRDSSVSFVCIVLSCAQITFMHPLFRLLQTVLLAPKIPDRQLPIASNLILYNMDRHASVCNVDTWACLFEKNCTVVYSQFFCSFSGKNEI